MLGIGSTEFAIIVIFGFLLFGPDKLPQMGRTLGRALRQFNETKDKMTSVVQTEVLDPMAAAANAAPKKPAVADDEDADVEGAETAPARKETFAERRARLAAEKAAGEGAASGEAPVDGLAPASEPAAAGVPAAESAPAAPEAPAEEAPAPRTTADLYARRPRRHRADEAEAEAPAEEAPAGEAPATEGGER